MNNKITIFLLSHSGSPIRRFTTSKGALLLAGFLISLLICLLVFLSHHQIRLQHAAVRAVELERRVESQKDEILQQRRQIQSFALRLNTLKSKLVGLSEFEEKIRVIANLEEKVDQEGVFGIGGTAPEDLDANIPLSQKHDSLLRDMHTNVDALTKISEDQEKDFVTLFESLEARVNILACTPAIRPLKGGWITSHYGNRKDPFTGLREFHKGLDIATRFQENIVATGDGRVSFAGKKGLLGKVIVIDHGHGIVTRYGHLNKVLKKVGEKVKRGERIALVGKSGRTTGPHLHYEVLLNGVPVNPEKYILN